MVNKSGKGCVTYAVPIASIDGANRVPCCAGECAATFNVFPSLSLCFSALPSCLSERLLQNSKPSSKSPCISPLESLGTCECVGIPAKNPVVSKWGTSCGKRFPRSAAISTPWPVSAVIERHLTDYLNSQLLPTLVFFRLRWAQSLPFCQATTTTKRKRRNVLLLPTFTDQKRSQ